MKYAPLALLVLFHVLVFLRGAIHRRRTGGDWNFLHRGRTPLERWRARGFRVLLLAAWVQCGRAALERIPLAPSPGLQSAGCALAIVGILLMFAAQLQLGDSWRIGIEPGVRPGLVARGMYRWSRNPIFLWMLVSWSGLALLVFDPLLALLVVLLALGVRSQVREEERWLLATYGESYREYASRVGRFLPGIGRLAKQPGPGAS